MGWKDLVIVLLLFNLTTSCCIPLLQKKFHKTEYQSYRPNNSKFLLKKNRIKNDKDILISQNIIYTRIDSIYIKSVEDKKTRLLTVNSFIRFFETGQCLSSSTDNFKTGLKNFNNLKSGSVGYYQINKETISFEYFNVGSHDCGKYETITLKILGDSIEGYKKLHMEELTGTPDW